MIVLSFVTLVSLLVATTMSVIAWRLAAEERRRSSARVASLAADIHVSHLDLAPAPPESDRESAPPSELFAIAQPAQSGSRLATVVACGVIVVGSIATLGLLLGNGSHTTKAAKVETQTTPAGLANPVPLELVALGHDRTGDDLTVRGVIRNP